MSLASDTYSKSEVPVDFYFQPADLVRASVRVMIRSANSLDILCRPGAPSWPSGPSPSRIRKVSDYAFVRRDDGKYGRDKANVFIGLPGRRRYRAAGTSVYHFRYDGLVLSVSGIKIGSVRTMGGEFMNRNIPETWMTLGGWPKRAGSSPQSFGRTIITDRAPDWPNPPSWYGKAFEYSFKKSFAAGVDMNKLVR